MVPSEAMVTAFVAVSSFRLQGTGTFQVQVGPEAWVSVVGSVCTRHMQKRQGRIWHTIDQDSIAEPKLTNHQQQTASTE